MHRECGLKAAYLVASHTLKLPIERVDLFPHLLRPLFGGLCTGTALRGILLIFGQYFGDVGMNAIVKPLGANPCAIALLGAIAESSRTPRSADSYSANSEAIASSCRTRLRVRSILEKFSANCS